MPKRAFPPRSFVNERMPITFATGHAKGGERGPAGVLRPWRDLGLNASRRAIDRRVILGPNPLHPPRAPGFADVGVQARDGSTGPQVRPAPPLPPLCEAAED